MSYASLQDLIDRFGDRELIQLTDRTNRPASVIDQTVVGRALADADALIDGYVGKVHALPLAAVPPALVKTAADIARFYLHSKPEKDGAVCRRGAFGLCGLAMMASSSWNLWRACRPGGARATRRNSWPDATGASRPAGSGSATG
ncbi:hypothetical protein ASF65_04740 [Aureimonas sp. Leaf324]|nr:DUF1320 domain-containing protein [Aureimonas sp. Leaf324]KQQ85847.1 hypothetical protein ASF65_04740 [Aureimonas sp. Leaf324]